MTPWQVLRASGATQAALGYRVHHHHGTGGLVHYSTAPAVAADGCRSFCLSTEKLTLQQLNSRLASYMQQVQYLEMANQKLECQIQKELDRKCPSELRELDGHLRTVSLLQEQISECLSAQAQVKLHLLSAELTVHDLSVRCETERERHGSLEVELNNLRLLEEELQVHRLPELQILLNDQTQQLMELQTQHQQDMQCLLAQMSEGVTVEMQPVRSLDLKRQLEGLRQTNVTLLDKKQNDCWSNTQVSMLSSPLVTFDPQARSEVIQAEWEELRRKAVSLEQELTQLQAVNAMLEATSLEQNESIVQQLVVLQQRADSLCSDLDSVLQATAQQAADHQTLLDIKTRLETEIQDYRRLLDGLIPQGPSALRRQDITVNKAVSVQGANLRMMEFQTGSRGHVSTARQTPVVAPLSETITTTQSISEHPKTTPVTMINTSNLMSSFHKSENQRTGTLSERNVRESMTFGTTINRQSTSVEDKVPTECRDLQNSSIVSTQISQSLDKGAVVKACKPETSTAQGITTLAPKRQSIWSAEGGLQANKTRTNIQTEIKKTICCAEPEVKQGLHLITQTVTNDSNKQNSVEIKKETENVTSVHMSCTEGSIQAKNQDLAQVVSLSLETTTEAVGEAGECAVTASFVSGSHVLIAEEAQGEVSDELNLMVDKNIERQEKKEGERVVEVEGTSHVLTYDHSVALPHASNSQQNTVMEDARTRINIATASSNSPDNNDNLESKTAQDITALVSETESVSSVGVQAKLETFTSKQTTTEAGLEANKKETNIQTVISETILCVEPEAKQETNFIPCTTITDPSKKTAADERRETENVTSVHMSCTEDSMQAKNQDPAQVVSLSLETTTEAVVDAEECAVTPSFVSGSHALRSMEAQDDISGDLNLKGGKNIGGQEKKEGKDVVEVEGTPYVLRLNQSVALSHASNSEQNKVMEDADTGSNMATTLSSSPDSDNNLKSTTVQGISMLVTNTHSVFSATVQAKPETLTSKQSATEAGLQAIETETNIQTVINKTILCVEPEVKLEPNFITCTTITDPSKKTAADVKRQTEDVTSVHMSCTEDSIQAKNQDPAQVASFSLETTTGTVRETGECAGTASFVSGSHVPSSGEAQDEVSDDLTLMINKKQETRQEKKGDKEVELHTLPVPTLDHTLELSDVSNSEQIKVMEFADTASNTATASSDSPDSNDNLECKAARGITMLVHDTQSVSNARDQAKPETFTSIQTTTETDLQSNKTETNIQTVTTETVLRGQPEVKPGPQFLTHATVTDPSKKTATEVKKETETVTSAQMSCTEDSMQAKNQNPAQVASLSLETDPSKRNRLDQISAIASASNREHNKVMEESNTGSGTSTASYNGGSLGHTSMRLSKTGTKENPTESTLPATTQQKIERFSNRGSWECKVYGSSLEHKSSLNVSTSLPSKGKEESPSVAATSKEETGRFGSRQSGEWIVYSGSLGRKSGLRRAMSEESPSAAMLPAKSLPEIKRFGGGGSGSLKRTSSLAGSDGLPSADKEEFPSLQKASSTPESLGTGRFGSGGIGEWRVYGGSIGRLSSNSSTDRVSNPKISQPSSKLNSEARLSSAGSGGRLSSDSVRRSSSVGSGGRLFSSSSGGRLSNSSGSQGTSTSGRFGSTGSSEWKPVYSSAIARKSSVGSTGRSGVGGAISSQRVSSSGGRMIVSMGSGGWLNSSTAGSPGSGSKLSSSGGSDRISSLTGGKISSSSGSGRTNSTGGRVISSSDRPIRSTGSGAGGSKERISVCKMAALSISAAGRERNQDKQRQAQRPQQQQAGGTSPLLQRWLSTGVRVQGANSDGLDDIMHH